MSDKILAVVFSILLILGIYIEIFKKVEKDKITSKIKYKLTDVYKLRKELQLIYSSYAKELNDDNLIKKYTPKTACKKYNKNNDICEIIFKKEDYND